MTDPTQPSPAALAAMLSGSPEGMPAPPSRAALAAVLAQAAEPDCWLLANGPAEESVLSQRVDMANGWRLWIRWKLCNQLDMLWAATAPDGAHWSYGCDRWPDWGAGPDAVVLDPIHHLMSPEQRERLRQRLLTCSCWPEPEPLPVPPPPTKEQLDAFWDVELMAS
jgi:hypothetical protein